MFLCNDKKQLITDSPANNEIIFVLVPELYTVNVEPFITENFITTNFVRVCSVRPGSAGIFEDDTKISKKAEDKVITKIHTLSRIQSFSLHWTRDTVFRPTHLTWWFNFLHYLSSYWRDILSSKAYKSSQHSIGSAGKVWQLRLLNCLNTV